MKSILFLLLIAQCSQLAAQNIGIGTTTPNASAQLDISSTAKGILVPRMTTTQRNTIPAPAKGLLVFDSTSSSFWFYSGSAWTELTTTNTVWGVNGNSSAVDGTNFIGTTNNVPLSFRQNNISMGRLDAGKNNVFLGDLAGGGALETGNNTFIGDHAGYAHFGVGVGHNTFVGSQAGYANTLATDNTYLGAYAGYSNITAGDNTMIGKNAGYTNKNSNNTFIGAEAGYLNNTGNGNTFIGRESGALNIAGNNNLYIGNRAGYAAAGGSDNISLGFSSGNGITTGNDNISIGEKAGYYLDSGVHNVSIGSFAGYYGYDYDHNVSIGANAGGHGGENISIGRLAGFLSGSTECIYVGPEAGTSNTGYRNVFIGSSAGSGGVTGARNTFVGGAAGSTHTSGGYCTFIGGEAKGSTGTLENATAIGHGTIVNASNRIRLGNTLISQIGGYAPWTDVSDGRFKKNISENVSGLDFIMKLRPVTYNLEVNKLAAFIKEDEKTDSTRNKVHVIPNAFIQQSRNEKEQLLQTGFIAQEVEAAAAAAGYTFSGVNKPVNKDDLYGLSYSIFTVPLVKAVQEQQAIIKEQQKQIDELKALVNKLINNTVAK